VIGNVSDEAIAMRVESLIDESLNKVDTPVRLRRLNSIGRSLTFGLSMIFSENRCPLFGIMLWHGGRRRLGVAKAPNQRVDCMNPFYELMVLISH
jgi:hypothetical protein